MGSLFYHQHHGFSMEINPILGPGEIFLGLSLDTLTKKHNVANLENLGVKVIIRSILDL